MVISDLGIVLYTKCLTMGGALVRCFLKKHGFISGYYRAQRQKSYGLSAKIGSIVHATLQIRTQRQMGAYVSLEQTYPYTAYGIVQGAFVHSAILLLTTTLTENEAYTELWQSTAQFLERVAGTTDMIEIATVYALFELDVLRYTGFQLELNVCVVTHSTENIAYISPRSGKAVSMQAGRKYHNQLFHMPKFFLHQEDIEKPSAKDILNALRITEFFFKKHLLSSLPLPRQMIVNMLERQQ